MTHARADHRGAWAFAAGLFAASLAVRATFLVLLVGIDTPLQGDELDYHRLAASWASGGGWREHVNPLEYWLPDHAAVQSLGYFPPQDHRSARPPWTPFFLALVYRLFGPSVTAARLALLIVASSTAVAIYWVGCQMWGTASRTARLVASCWVVYPHALYSASQVMTETWAALLVLLAVGAFLRAARRGGTLWAIALGACWGALALDRANFFLLPPWLLLVQWMLPNGSAAPRLRGPACIAACVAYALVLAPWTVRNARLHGAFLPTTTDASRLLAACNLNLDQEMVRSGGYYHDPRFRGWIESYPEGMWNRVGARLVRQEIGAQPWQRLPAIVGLRALHFWSHKIDPYESIRRPLQSATSPRWQAAKRVRNLVTAATWWPILVVFLMSLWRRPWRTEWCLLAVVAYAFLLTLPFWGTPRFRFPVEALVLLRAGTWWGSRGCEPAQFDPAEGSPP